MKSRDFCYWLQGLFELADPNVLNVQQTKMIKQHLALVFKHEIDEPDPTGELQDVHDGEPEGTTITLPHKDTLYRC